MRERETERERWTDRQTDSHKSRSQASTTACWGHSFFRKPFPSPSARALGLRRKTAVRERPLLLTSPLCASSDLTTSLSEQTSCGLPWTWEWIVTPKPVAQKHKHKSVYARVVFCEGLPGAQKEVPWGSQFLLFYYYYYLFFISVHYLMTPSLIHQLLLLMTVCSFDILS